MKLGDSKRPILIAPRSLYKNLNNNKLKLILINDIVYKIYAMVVVTNFMCIKAQIYTMIITFHLLFFVRIYANL